MWHGSWLRWSIIGVVHSSRAKVDFAGQKVDFQRIVAFLQMYVAPDKIAEAMPTFVGNCENFFDHATAVPADNKLDLSAACVGCNADADVILSSHVCTEVVSQPFCQVERGRGSNKLETFISNFLVVVLCVSYHELP